MSQFIPHKIQRLQNNSKSKHYEHFIQHELTWRNWQAGYGLTIQYPDATRKDISEGCGQHCNNYDAELKAIRSTLQTISEDCDNPNPPCVNNIVILTDSQSAIQAIAQMQHYKQPIVTDNATQPELCRDIHPMDSWTLRYSRKWQSRQISETRNL